MKNTLTSLLTYIVDDPSQIQVNEELINDTYIYTIAVAKEDMGKVIGKEGKIIRAIRNALKIPAAKTNKRIRVVLAEEGITQQ